jgi:pyridoxamine 5'-phosphate oxidase
MSDRHLDESTIDPDPIKQFQAWFDDAINAGLILPEAMTVATSTKDGRPSARVLLLKQVDQDGFVFFTNYLSAKSQDLDENPYASLVFWWPPLEKQVRIEGRVIKTSRQESQQYFSTRPRESQIGAWASRQSAEISGRDELENRSAEFEQLYAGRPVDCPEHWGGYRLTPDRIEFWKGREGRLHDRIVYERQADGWTTKRLAP